MDLDSLKNILPASALLLEEEKLRDLAVDGVAPQAAAFPGTVEEAAKVVALAHDQGWGVAIRGRGTKTGLGNPPARVDLVLGLERLNRIIDLDPANLTATVQAGVPLADLQDLVSGVENRCFFPLDGELKEKADALCSDREHKGAFVPLDPPFKSRATMGGILATGSVGPSRLGHGLPRDLVLGTRLIRADGAVIGMGGKTVKNVSGYDVSKLMIGSLGSLGVICEATLRLLPLPRLSCGVVLVFGELGQALGCCAEILNSKLIPTCLELMNRAGAQVGARAALAGPANGWWMALKLDGSEAEVGRQVSDLQAMGKRHEALSTTVQDADQAARMWNRLSEPEARTVFKGHFPFGAYARLASAWSGLSQKAGLECGLSVRAGCGTATAFLATGTPQEQASLGLAMRNAAQDLGGGMVVEAAGPELKQRLDVWGPLPSGFRVMQNLKNSLDPKNILNPGRFLGGL